MAYAAWSVTFGEQPTASKWNILGTNDASFNDGTGIAAAAIVSAHLDANLAGGWVAAGETWTYASADAPTFTFTISGDKTSKYSVGMKIKLTQTTVKYFIITAISYSAPNTTVTVYGGTDYTLANAAITSPFVSLAGGAPYGFPLTKDKWTVKVSVGAGSQASPTQNQWYNAGSGTISLPIGAWDLSHQSSIAGTKASAGDVITQCTLSTANNSESDSELTGKVEGNPLTQTGYGSVTRSKEIVVAAKTPYYFNIRTTLAGQAGIFIETAILKAVCNYL